MKIGVCIRVEFRTGNRLEISGESKWMDFFFLRTEDKVWENIVRMFFNFFFFFIAEEDSLWAYICCQSYCVGVWATATAWPLMNAVGLCLGTELWLPKWSTRLNHQATGADPLWNVYFLKCFVTRQADLWWCTVPVPLEWRDSAFRLVLASTYRTCTGAVHSECPQQRASHGGYSCSLSGDWGLSKVTKGCLTRRLDEGTPDKPHAHCERNLMSFPVYIKVKCTYFLSAS